jgi:putative transposase
VVFSLVPVWCQDLGGKVDGHGSPELINIDKSGSNKRSFTKIEIRQYIYLNNIVDQSHRFIKWRIQHGLGAKNIESARRTKTGIEIDHMIKKNQLNNQEQSMFKSFSALAA